MRNQLKMGLHHLQEATLDSSKSMLDELKQHIRKSSPSANTDAETDQIFQERLSLGQRLNRIQSQNTKAAVDKTSIAPSSSSNLIGQNQLDTRDVRANQKVRFSRTCKKCGSEEDSAPLYCSFHPYLISLRDKASFGPEWQNCKLANHKASDAPCFRVATHQFEEFIDLASSESRGEDSLKDTSSTSPHPIKLSDDASSRKTKYSDLLDSYLRMST
eukprot:TRINITY_DN11013_c0_g1_i2.p1 TRINITY_DN11013_c0_g1~~TRINITY_DN11013_c0_g1_i2.p1  ORF type:complete len:216 (+),score=33.18 TRINITY_DN11013_c0_g1_i2:211-858(+)